ncbi:hypothetical protein NQ176_g2862 [Zarea fungicola]|uniref:Uncharacterized protein n=1 Tax=Zarea fungicola TaxID=93591 RepID=A0ACC1NLW8_9HYPO|nr:hypothetical protein NQ176_g2862 [Lecanicillium fungicola]
MSPVIVFGPTGSVGSVVAATAGGLGAKVDAGFQRLQADLADAASVKAAVRTTGATRAFVYLNWDSSDHMRATFTALKACGIEFVVFLSSFTIQGDRHRIPASAGIPFHHAQAELSLEEVFGVGNYAALRAGAFATNSFRYKYALQAGRVSVSGMTLDWITAEDIGRVGASVLVHGPKNGQQIIYLYGPKRIHERDAVEIIANTIGRPVQIKDGAGMSRLATFRGNAREPPRYREGVDNISLYTGNPAMDFETWARLHQEEFQH